MGIWVHRTKAYRCWSGCPYPAASHWGRHALCSLLSGKRLPFLSGNPEEFSMFFYLILEQTADQCSQTLVTNPQSTPSLCRKCSLLMITLSSPNNPAHPGDPGCSSPGKGTRPAVATPPTSMSCLGTTHLVTVFHHIPPQHLQ